MTLKQPILSAEPIPSVNFETKPILSAAPSIPAEPILSANFEAQPILSAASTIPDEVETNENRDHGTSEASSINHNFSNNAGTPTRTEVRMSLSNFSETPDGENTIFKLPKSRGLSKNKKKLKKGANFLICFNLGFFLIMAFYFELFRNRWEEFGESAGLLKRKIKGISFCWIIAGARF
ncbi:hypothetical protein LXL04_014543 [Taraxacum kok-saghyz]